jgi:hypothetical protein
MPQIGTFRTADEKQETHSFQLPELKKGVYLYSIETPTGMQSGKLLIE